jgi:hypothetical protein
MQATTIKLDPKLHSSIRRMKAREQSLTAYVRELVAREERRAALEAAADAYTALLARNKGEAEAMEEWESAPLADAPKRRRK